MSSPVAAMATSQVSMPGLLQRGQLAGVGQQPLGLAAALSDLIARGSLSISRTSCPFSTSSRGDRPADVAGPGDGDPHLSLPSEHRAVIRLGGGRAWPRPRRAGRRRPRRRPGRRPGRPCCAWAPIPAPSRKRNGTRAPVAVLDLLDGPADPGAVDVHLHQPDRARRVAPLRLGAGRQQPAQHLVGRPAHRGHGRDAQPLVHLGAARVVDPGDHVVARRRSPGPPGRTRCWSCRRWTPRRSRRPPRCRPRAAPRGRSRRP